MSDALVFSRPVKVDTLPRDGLRQTIHADEAERAALAQAFGLVAIARLDAELLAKRTSRGVKVTGKVRAAVTQTCVVSLEPFDSEIEEEVDVRFQRPAEERKGRVHEETLHFDAEDEPDMIVDGQIDLGALAAEFIALGLDPYPRKPGVEFAAPATDADETSPFAPLGGLKDD